MLRINCCICQPIFLLLNVFFFFLRAVLMNKLQSKIENLKKNQEEEEITR